MMIILQHYSELAQGDIAALAERPNGPGPQEHARGFKSRFSRKTAGVLKNVAITDDGTAVVDFADFTDRVNNASTSAGAGQLIRELSQTVFQFDEIKAVEYRFDGSCDAFFNWLQSSCTVVSASDYRQMQSGSDTRKPSA